MKNEEIREKAWDKLSCKGCDQSIKIIRRYHDKHAPTGESECLVDETGRVWRKQLIPDSYSVTGVDRGYLDGDRIRIWHEVNK